MPEEINKPKLPRLEPLFFAVCKTAIENCAWPYKDFPKIEFVKGQLQALEIFLNDLYAREAEQMAQVSAPTPNVAETPLPAVQEEHQEVISEQPEVVKSPEVKNQVATEPVSDKVVSPEEAKKAPVRPMPDDILEVVQVGVEIAKNPPKVKDVKVSEIPADEDAARKEWNKPF